METQRTDRQDGSGFSKGRTQATAQTPRFTAHLLSLTSQAPLVLPIQDGTEPKTARVCPVTEELLQVVCLQVALCTVGLHSLSLRLGYSVMGV